MKKIYIISLLCLSLLQGYNRVAEGTKLDFKDALLVPKASSLASRNDVSVVRSIYFKHADYTWTGVPLVVSNMDTTGTIDMALGLQKHKIVTCLHKFYKPGDIPKELDRNYYMVSTGINEKDLNNLDKLLQIHDPLFVCIDVANGYSDKFLNAVKQIRKKYPKKVLVGGNVVTPERAQLLIKQGGLDIVKVGIGSGSVCTTRLQTGVGYPQLSAVLECAEAAHMAGGYIMSDGGVQCPGDIAKAFGAGAAFVMCGSMFAGHDESGGQVVDIEGQKFKIFYGMSSDTAMHKHHGGVADYRSSEGKTVKVAYKGPVQNTILHILGGIRSAMTYIGASTLEQIPHCANFIRVNTIANRMYNGHEIK